MRLLHPSQLLPSSGISQIALRPRPSRGFHSDCIRCGALGKTESRACAVLHGLRTPQEPNPDARHAAARLQPGRRNAASEAKVHFPASPGREWRTISSVDKRGLTGSISSPLPGGQGGCRCRPRGRDLHSSSSCSLSAAAWMALTVSASSSHTLNFSGVISMVRACLPYVPYRPPMRHS